MPRLGRAKNSSSRSLLLFASVALAPLAFRAILIADRTQGIALADWRGFLSDLSMSLFAVGLVLLVGLVSRWLALLLVGTWVLAHYVNVEIVRELDALASVLDAGFLADPTFLAGSVQAIAWPGLLAATLIVSLALARPGLAQPSWKHAPAFLVAAALLLAGHVFWPWTDEVASWRQTNVVQYNAAYALSPNSRAERRGLRFSGPPAAMLDLDPSLGADLSGSTFLPDEGRARNVLLIVIESLSGGHVRALAADHGVETPHLLNALDAQARRSISFSTFFANQRKTNRGMYTILCGELPNLLPGIPKMSQYAVGGRRRCLPELLRSAGYATVYMQAAPLAFMLKDQFMPRAGFERVYGYDHYEGGYARTAWGVDDRSLYEQSLPMIDELQRGERPWFLTLLTVTTHHPYTVPDSFTHHEGFPHAQALAYADLAIGEFLWELTKRRVRQDTLVLITSDESMGQVGKLGSDAVARLLAENWGILIALTPDRQVRRVKEPFSQVDLALSILDYLGLGERGSHFFGRSVFREYPEGRSLYFANTNHLMLGVLDPFRHLLLCRLGEAGCRRYRADRGRIFGVHREALPPSVLEDELVREMAQRSVRPPSSEPRRRDYQLVTQREIVVAPATRKVLHGGQYLDLGPGQWLEIELELEARGETGFVRIDHLTTQANTWAAKRRSGGVPALVGKSIDLRDGQTLHWKYTIAPGEVMYGLQSRSTVQSHSSAPFELIFKTARMSVRSTGDRPDEMIRTEIFEITPAPSREPSIR